jgi:ATP-binding cassette subfamily E protein 1
VHRYGENGFALYGLPLPKEEKRFRTSRKETGSERTTTVKLLAGTEKINLGKNADDPAIKDFFKGNEILKYLESLPNKKVSYKPQNLSKLSADVKVIDLLKQRGSEEEISLLAKRLGVKQILENKLNKLSGGELQRVAIIMASLGEADIYFFDEPLAYLDINERLRVSDFIRELASGKTVIVVEHDLLT